MSSQKKSIIFLFGALMLTMLLASLSQMIFSAALPTIVGELHGVEHMAWVVTAYMLASTIALIFIKEKKLATRVKEDIPAESLAEGQLTES